VAEIVSLNLTLTTNLLASKGKTDAVNFLIRLSDKYITVQT